ncbi:GMC family oxidoreductase [Streptomyces sp. NBC_01716]|uniref:GMC family oxidoreductase n=1 Tax=Streptomyces sp. NBC_01716 TaxID=2975917 RepID=UPI002E312579|nr:GMC family oxidoreductase [Streptomyces sp. NBC_01716]
MVSYAVDHPADLETIRRGLETSVRLHVAAGARRVIAVAEGAPTWQEGEDLDAYLQALSDLSVGAGGWTIVAAHQMGTCRMGTDPTVSVADTWGQLHDTKGVWIDDSSALPTALGVNPMITIMALARRTARSIIDDEPAWTYDGTTPQVPPTHHE